MLAWITENIGTILISAVLLLVVVLIAIVTFISLSLIRQKRQGKSSCGGNCAHCGAQCHSCHPKGQ